MAHAVDIYMYPTPKSSVIFLSALVISFAQKGREIKNRFTRLIESASDISYALFVSHFFVIIVFSGVWKLCGLDGFALAYTMFLATWLVATLMASFLNSFYSRLIVRMFQFKGAVK
jgi:peptidoglycan/LPS O-acetylase OafA/YrhL